jgi:ketosteroid isomerase-like protein
MSPQSDPADALTANKAVALAFLQAMADGDLVRLDALLHPQARWWVLGWGERDKTSFLTALTSTIADASSRSMQVVGVTAEGDRVAVEAQGEFVQPKGAYRNTYHYLFRVRDGVIVEGREYLDTTVARTFFSA